MSRTKALFVAALSLAFAASLLPAQTIDQSQQTEAALFVGRTGTDTCTSGCASIGWGLQGFRPTMATSAGAAFYLSPFPDVSGTLTIELWDKSPGLAGANKLAGGATALGGIPAYYTVSFAAPVAVTIGQPYFLAFYSAAKFNIHANYDVYAGGAFNYNNSTLDTTPYVGNGCCDTRFIEYAASPAAAPTVAPEPSTVFLMGAGLMSLAAVGRTKRRRA